VESALELDLVSLEDELSLFFVELDEFPDA
jgi:hypothetical protein